MNYDAVVASAVGRFPRALEFQRLFPNAEHTIVDAQRDFHPEGWKPVSEWISRSHLHDRYVVWLVVAVEIEADGNVLELEEPQLYVVEIEDVHGCGDDEDGQSWEIGCSEFEEGDWQRLVECGGDFAALECDMTTDAPVDRFATFWHDTRPCQRFAASTMKAPLRFMM